MTAGPVLGFDVCAGACSAAIVAESGLLAHELQPMARGHAEALMPMIRAVMQAAGLGFAELAGLGVTVGPGSFTGVRVGLAAARGLALASGRPLVGVTSFAAIARGVPQSLRAGRILLLAIDTKRRDLYAEIRAPEDSILLEGAVQRPEELPALLPPGAVLLAGDGASLAAPPLLAAGRAVETLPVAAPDAADVAALALERLRAGGPLPPVRPVYLRAAEAVLPDAGGRLRP